MVVASSNRTRQQPAKPSAKRSAKPAPEASDLLAAVEVVAAFVSAFEPERYSVADATTLLSAFTRVKRLGTAGEAHCARRVAESHAHLRSGHRTPAEWLAAQTGESVGEAGKLLSLGENLLAQPRVDEAFRKGELSPSRTQLISDAARVNPGKEDDLVEGAKGPATQRQVRDECLRAKAQGRTPDEAARHDRALHEARRCRTFVDRDGAFHLDARFHPSEGARLLSVLDQRTDRLFQRARAEGRCEPTDAYRADALVALICGGAAGHPATPPADRAPADRTGRAGRASADLDHDDPPSRRDQVNLRVDLAALRRGSVGTGEICEIPGVGPVSLETAREIMGDALLRVIITDGVDVTTICHPGRTLPAALRTAVFERDQCCVVPGCDTRLGLETDHWAIDYSDDGPLSLMNACRLCKHHHQLKTHNGFTLAGGPGTWRWVAPDEPKITPRQKKKLAKTRTKTKTKTTTGQRPRRSTAPDPPLFTLEE